MPKVLEWKFDDKYEDKIVICNYITHKHADNVIAAFDDIDEAMVYMDEHDMWDDNYIYHIVDGYARAPQFGWVSFSFNISKIFY